MTTRVLHHLKEVDRRQLHLARGYSSLFEYAVLELGYSESSAQRRISSMRLLKEFPELEAKIQSGSLSLSVVSQAQTFFRQEKTKVPEKREILQLLENTSSREAEKILALHSGRPLSKDAVKLVGENQAELRLSVTRELLDDLDKLRGLLAHQLPNASLSELVQFAVTRTLRRLDPAQRATRKNSKPLPTPEVKRVVRAKLKAEVWKRDGGKCTYVDKQSGRRCNTNFAIQIDHIKPFALGGPTSLENLRLLCAKHNRMESRRIFDEIETIQLRRA